MNEQKYPQLERLHVLRTEALCSIRDRAFDSLQVYTIDHGDGIISGCHLTTNRDSITLNSGLIRHDDFLYLILEPMSIPYEPTDEDMILKLVFESPIETENFIKRNVELNLTHEINISHNEMELCRFKLKKGAMLRTKYVDFFDRATEFDTVNTINSPYSAINGSNLSPEITKAFAIEARDYTLEQLDYNFCLEALSGRAINAEQIGFYIEQRLKIDLIDRNNKNLYDNLCLILQEIKNNGRREIKGQKRRRREVFVD